MATYTPTFEEAQELAQSRPANLWRDTLRNILSQRSAQVGLALLAIIVFMALFAPIIATHEPTQVVLDAGETRATGAIRNAPPCIHLLGCPANKAEHLLGLDSNLRDEFSRVVFASQVSLQVGFLTVGFAILVGTILGSLAGYAGGWTDNVIMRLMDVLLAFPALVLAIFLVVVFRSIELPLISNPLWDAMLAIAVVAVPVYARVMRASVLSIKERDFVTASRALGESSIGILLRRILPNALTPLIVQGTLGIASAILDVAALSFLGLGATPPLAEWGSMIGDARNVVFRAPWLVMAPGVMIAMTVLAFNLLGDGLRDALDPRLNR
jgi:ABC-type dipeptide/oligopeptide/nickel transport system permease subunit